MKPPASWYAFVAWIFPGPTMRLASDLPVATHEDLLEGLAIIDAALIDIEAGVCRVNADTYARQLAGSWASAINVELVRRCGQLLTLVP